MARTTLSLLGFNRGIVSRLGLARLDLKDHLFLSAAKQKNWMPRVLGSMMLRPALQQLDSTDNDNLAYFIPFVFSSDDKALIELTDGIMRVWIGGAPITRPAVTTAVTNGTFNSNVTSWTDSDESGATSVWVAGGFMGLTGTGYKKAIRSQQVTVDVGNRNKEHALEIVIERGPVTIKVGSTVGDTDYVDETILKTGTHSLSFTPTNDFFIQFENVNDYQSLVDSVAVAASGPMRIVAPWDEATLSYVRYDQSADVVFVACIPGSDINAPRRIERRGDGRSWSIVKYEPDDGPFMLDNTGTTTIAASALTGDITLTASQSLFRTSHVGALFRVASVGQATVDGFNGDDQFSNSIRVTGIGSSRIFSIVRSSLTGTGTTVTLQRSQDNLAWEDVTTYTTTGSVGYNDGLDNQIWYYRVGVKSGDYSTGPVGVTLTYVSGSLTGIVRITAYTSSTSVSARVLVPLGGTDASDSWAEGRWSDYRGWPSAVRLFQGRLWLAGKQYIWGSVSDAYESHDDTLEGDSGPIQRSIGSGPLDKVNWLLPLTRLFLGTDGAEWQAKSSSFDEPLSPTEFSLVSQGTQGSAAVDAVKMDSSGFFLQSSTRRIYAISYKYTGLTDDYGSEDVTRFAPEIAGLGITRMAMQRQPDSRLHCVRADGDAAILILEKNESVLCWVEVETEGLIEDVVMLPGASETEVYYVVNRTINGSTKRYLEQWAMESECSFGTFNYDGAAATVINLLDGAGDKVFLDKTKVTARDADGNKIGNFTVLDGTITLGAPVTYALITPTIYKLADCMGEYSGVATDTITGADHLEGCEVVVWADGKDFSPGRDSDPNNPQVTYTVTSGHIVLPAGSQVQHAIYGLPYRARYQSSKLGYVGDGVALNNQRRLVSLGLILADTHAKGIHYGDKFSLLDDLPGTGIQGEVVPDDYIWQEFDDKKFSIASDWGPDSRLCLEANAPRPATVMAAIILMEITA